MKKRMVGQFFPPIRSPVFIADIIVILISCARHLTGYLFMSADWSVSHKYRIILSYRIILAQGVTCIYEIPIHWVPTGSTKAVGSHRAQLTVQCPFVTYLHISLNGVFMWDFLITRQWQQGRPYRISQFFTSSILQYSPHNCGEEIASRGFSILETFPPALAVGISFVTQP